MKKGLVINHEIDEGIKEAARAEELYQLLSTYNAYNLMLLKAEAKQNGKKHNLERYYLYTTCFKHRIEDLFNDFKNDECLRVRDIRYPDHKDMLFLIDHDTLLRIYTFDDMNSTIVDESVLDYDLIKLKNCHAQVFDDDVYCGDPYYCDRHFEKKEAFGLIDSFQQITPSYKLTDELKKYHNNDIHDILKVQSFDDIYEKITETKKERVKELSLK